jgi:hypothetical protein
MKIEHEEIDALVDEAHALLVSLGADPRPEVIADLCHATRLLRLDDPHASCEDALRAALEYMLSLN